MKNRFIGFIDLIGLVMDYIPKKFSDILYPIISDNIPGYKEMITKDLGFELFKKHFKYKSEYDDFFNKIKDDEKKFKKYDHILRFYYFWCKEPNTYQFLKPDFKLIVIFSIMEYLMSEEKHLQLNEWLQSEMKTKPFQITNAKELEDLLDMYYKTHGSRRKIKKFLENFCEEGLFKSFFESLKKYDEAKKETIEVKNIDEVIRFIEGIRNLFIHKAEDIQIESYTKYANEAREFTSYHSETLTHINGTLYFINNSSFHIESILNLFEKGVISYFIK